MRHCVGDGAGRRGCTVPPLPSGRGGDANVASAVAKPLNGRGLARLPGGGPFQKKAAGSRPWLMEATRDSSGPKPQKITTDVNSSTRAFERARVSTLASASIFSGDGIPGNDGASALAVSDISCIAIASVYLVEVRRSSQFLTCGTLSSYGRQLRSCEGPGSAVEICSRILASRR